MAAPRKTTPAPAEPTPQKPVEERPTMVALTDRADRVQIRFLAREIRLRNGRYAAIKSGVAHVKLTAEAKEIAVWGGYGDDARTAMITSEGYRKLNTVAQVTVLTPPSVEIPGMGRMANPYVTFSKETGAFESGWERRIAVAPGPTGNMVLTDRTTYLSLVEYLMEDLIGVSKRNPAAVCWGTRAQSPVDLLTENVKDHNAEKRALAKKLGRDWPLKYVIDDAELERAMKGLRRGSWGFYPVERITGQGLWFDRHAEAVAGVFRSYAQTGKFGVRKLEAIGYRNVLRDHPLMPGMSLSPEQLHDVVEKRDGKDVIVDVWTEVPVFFHEQVEDEAAVKALLQDFESGMRTAAFTEVNPDAARKPERIGVVDAEAEPGDEPEAPEQAPESAVEEVFGGGAARPEGPQREARAPDANAGLLAEIQTAEEILGTADVRKILKAHPEVERSRAKASTKALAAYFAALNTQINLKNQ